MATPLLPLCQLPPPAVNSFNVAAFRRTISSISFWLRLCSLSLSHSRFLLLFLSLAPAALLPFPSFSFCSFRVHFIFLLVAAPDVLQLLLNIA